MANFGFNSATSGRNSPILGRIRPIRTWPSLERSRPIRIWPILKGGRPLFCELSDFRPLPILAFCQFWIDFDQHCMKLTKLEANSTTLLRIWSSLVRMRLASGKVSHSSTKSANVRRTRPILGPIRPCSCDVCCTSSSWQRASFRKSSCNHMA